MKKLIPVLLLCVVFLVVLAPNFIASGDVGNAFSGGGVSSGGYSSSGNGDGIFIFLYIFMILPFPIKILLIGAIVYGAIAMPIKVDNTKIQRVSNNNDNFISIDDKVVSLIKNNDSNFSKYAFITYVKEVLISYQESMEARDLSKAALICSPKTYEQIKSAIEATTHFFYQAQEILDVSYKEYRVSGEYEFVKVEIFLSLYYYEIEGEKEQYGSKFRRVNHVYELEFMRNISLKTPETTISTTNCPKCGAPNSISTSGICEFCNNNIQSGDFSFVLDSISLIPEKKSIYYMKYHYGRLHALNREDDVVTLIQQIDEKFELEKFEEFAAKTIVDIQEAWEKRDMNLIRKYESEDLFTLHQTQIQEYIDKAQFPKIDEQKILDVHLNKFEVDGKYEYLTVLITCRVCVFVLDKDGNVISGNKKIDRKNGYSLRFKRGLGVKTSEQTNINNCPNCGALIELTNQGLCQYCNSNIISGEHGWIVDSYDAIYKI